MKTRIYGICAGLALGACSFLAGCETEGYGYGGGVAYYDYDYYPDWDIYYYPHGHYYYWNEGGDWRHGKDLPNRFDLHNRNSEHLHLHTQQPWTEHHVERGATPPPEHSSGEHPEGSPGGGHAPEHR